MKLELKRLKNDEENRRKLEEEIRNRSRHKIEQIKIELIELNCLNRAGARGTN